MSAATPGSVGPLCFGPVTDAGGNLVADGSCINGAVATDPGLDPNGLASNGGPTQTIALHPGSAAVNAGLDSACAATPVGDADQRGVPRPSKPIATAAHSNWRPLRSELSP